MNICFYDVVDVDDKNILYNHVQKIYNRFFIYIKRK